MLHSKPGGGGSVGGEGEAASVSPLLPRIARSGGRVGTTVHTTFHRVYFAVKVDLHLT
jgi:hypothetical protein